MSPFAPVDEVIAALAHRQHGVVAGWQLRAAGVSDEAIRRRVKRGQLTIVHQGVYRVGSVVAPLSRYMAAVLACGPRAVLSHRSAAALLGLLDDRGGPVDVTVTTNRKSRRGIRVHRTRELAKGDVTRKHVIPTTTAQRTIRDLAGVATTAELQRAAEGVGSSLTDAVEKGRGRRGAAALRAAAKARADDGFTRSEAERRLLALVRRAGLPPPVTNARVGRFEVDALWPEQRLIVEVDGYAFHGGRAAFESDRERDAELVGLGFRVVRVTWRQLVEEPEKVVARIARALS